MTVRTAVITLLFCGHLLASEPEQSFTIRAMLEPVREAVLSGELSARVTQINVDNGDAFSRGDSLVQFDCSVYEAGFDEARAELGIARVQLENKQKLQQLNSAGELEVNIARFEFDRMKARYDSAAILKKRCNVVAPFTGRVVETLVNEHESIEPGTDLIWLLDDSVLQVNLVLPSHWLAWLAVGSDFSLVIDETGLEYHGRIIRLGARVDAVSQSVRVTGELQSAGEQLIAGMSGTVSFRRQEAVE